MQAFLRSKATVFGFLLMLGISIAGILTGKQYLAQQEEAISAASDFQQDHIERYTGYFKDDLGLLLYYLKFSLIHKPDRLAGLSTGQGDINPRILSLTIRTLEAQKHDTDLSNPVNLQAGRMDIAFIIIYLFPLLIIAFTFNLISEEQEKGSWRLILVQSGKPLSFIWTKLAVRMAVVIAALLLILFLAGIWFRPSLNMRWWAFAYVSFWFGLSIFVTSFQKSSGYNAQILLSFWVILTMLLPAGINNYLSNRYPVPEAFSAMLQQRDGYHKKWDEDKLTTMNAFYKAYPEYAKYPLPQKTFSWIWYYAMQEMGDLESKAAAAAFREKMEQRERTSSILGFFIPTVHTQLQFNRLAKADLNHHLRFLDKTADFHTQWKHFFYPKIFEEKPVSSVDWAEITPEYFLTTEQPAWVLTLLPVLIFTFLLFAATHVKLKRMSGA